MKIILFISAFFIFSCNLDNDLIDYYNNCDDTEIEFKTISIGLKNNLDYLPMRVFVAETQKQHERGLMCIRNLPEEVDGMIFNYELEQDRAFWMYKTYIPLSIIYFDKNGTAVSKSNMLPCKRDFFESKNSHKQRCYLESRNYSPTKNYINALEISKDNKFIRKIMSSKETEDIQLIINY
ncbi:MAG: hypothetical protein CL773_04160 [Chloroflexi bacterium]|nr:hypothetical protein [Chloroflexota bacterium]|tara:strand:+ start:12622 stop:13161 length:540 start_codon:yes stop_codon:yes gene_type:complete